VLFPSRWPEPFGRIAIEAMAAGKPIVATRIGGIVDTVTMRTGILVPAGNPSALAVAIGKLLRNRTLRQRLGSDPMAMMAGNRLGLGFTPGRPWGPTNEARILSRALEGLRQITDAEEQLRLARMLGIASRNVRVAPNRLWAAGLLSWERRAMNTGDRMLVRTVSKRVVACARHNRMKGLLRSTKTPGQQLLWEIVR